MWLWGARSINWHEFDSDLIRKSYARVIRWRYNYPASFANEISQGVLKVNALAFFGAMARTGMARAQFWLEEVLETTAAWLRYARHFSPGRDLRLRTGASQAYKDAECTAWAARIGEALGYLVMRKRGFTYIDHLSSALDRIYQKNGAEPPQVSGQRADYFCEQPAGLLALAEFKGHIVGPGRRSFNLKSDLAGALKQAEATVASLAALVGQIRCYAVASYLKEVLDPYPEPSLIAISDPEVDHSGSGRGNDGFDIQEVRKAVRRGNYGGWLQIMGLTEEGYKLANYGTLKKGRVYPVHVLKYRGREFVFISFPPCWLHSEYSPECPALFRLGTPFVPWPFGHLGFGLELGVFRALLKVLRGKAHIIQLPDDPITFEQGDGDLHAYVFNDGAIILGEGLFEDKLFSKEFFSGEMLINSDE